MRSDDIRDVASQPPGYTLTWADLLAAYREGPKEAWSAVLLDRLGPWLTVAKRQLPAVPPYFDSDDVAQELAVEVLRIAARWRPWCEDGWIPRRLVERAARRINKTLLRERFAATQELREDIVSSERAEVELIFDTPIGKATASDLRLIFRARVLRQPIEDLAREAQIRPDEIRRRLRTALDRARTSGGLRERP